MFSKRINRLRNSLGFRLALWYSAVFIFSSLILFGVAYFFLSTAITKRDRENIWAHLHIYETQYHASGTAGLEGRFGYFVRLADQGDHTLFISHPDEWNDFDITQLDGMPITQDHQWIRLRSRDKDYVMNVLTKRLASGYLLQIGKRTDNLQDLLARFQIVFGVLILFGIGMGFAGGIIFAARGLKPVRSLVYTVRSIINTGNMNARVPAVETRDELGELVYFFNQMLEKIETLIKGMKDSLDNVAHDLRTPMTRLRSGAEMALSKSDGEETLREALSDCLEESDRVLTMLSTLMDISEAETGAMKLNLETINFSSLLDEVVDLYREVAEEKNVVLSSDFPEVLNVTIDPNRMRRVLANLVDNAIKYTPAGGNVNLSAQMERSSVVVQVKDSGVGIPEAEQEKIWDRLYRGDKSRSERGLGLGLSLVRAIVLAHHGTVSVASALGGGACFTMRLPTSSVGAAARSGGAPATPAPPGSVGSSHSKESA